MVVCCEEYCQNMEALADVVLTSYDVASIIAPHLTVRLRTEDLMRHSTFPTITPLLFVNKSIRQHYTHHLETDGVIVITSDCSDKTQTLVYKLVPRAPLEQNEFPYMWSITLEREYMSVPLAHLTPCHMLWCDTLGNNIMKLPFHEWLVLFDHREAFFYISHGCEQLADLEDLLKEWGIAQSIPELLTRSILPLAGVMASMRLAHQQYVTTMSTAC